MATSNAISGGIDYFASETYSQTAEYLRSKLPTELKTVGVGIVCGSGLGGLVDALQQPIVELHYKDIPNFALSTVAGHAGKLVFGMLANKPTVCMVGRKHLYEGHSPVRTTFPIRIIQLLGATALVVTNASGGLNPIFNVGDIMLISDHVSFAGLAGQNPLIGPNLAAFGPRFPPISDAYDFDLRVIAVKAAIDAGIPVEAIREGVYSFVTGPCFETRAEARFLRDALKADCVGMSTVPEVVVAKHSGLRVLGISLITNKVAVGHGRSALATALSDLGIAKQDASLSKIQDDELMLATHEEVLATSNQRAKTFQLVVKKIVEML